jgi:hypothetical protein
MLLRMKLRRDLDYEDAEVRDMWSTNKTSDGTLPEALSEERSVDGLKCKACGNKGYVKTAALLTFPCLVCRGQSVLLAPDEKERDGTEDSKVVPTGTNRR